LNLTTPLKAMLTAPVNASFKAPGPGQHKTTNQA